MRHAAAMLVPALLAGCARVPPASPPLAAEIRVQAVRVGSTPVQLAVQAGAGPGPTFLALHDDEDTAADVARAFVATHGGRLVEVRANGARLVTFALDGERLRFDPNRVFTPAGRTATLALHNPRVPTGAARELQRFAETVLALHGGAGVLVALHNNTEGGWSAASYRPGGDHAADAAAVHLPAGADADDFVLATTRAQYDALVHANVTTVQQHPAARDDGSLSVHAAREGIAYLNIEAQHGHGARQRALLDIVHRAGLLRPPPPERVRPTP